MCFTIVHNGKRYSEEFKQQIIFSISVTGLANEYGSVEQTIYKWKKLYTPSIEADENQTISIKEYKSLREKIHELKMENKTLKHLHPFHCKMNPILVVFHAN